MLELIVMVGVSGCGKTTYAKKHYSNYAVVSLDAVPDKDRLTWLKQIENMLQENRSVVADDENISKPKRELLTKLARKYGAQVKAIYLKRTLETILEQNNKRSGLDKVSEDHIIPLYHALKPNFDNEDFDDVEIIKDS